MGLGSWLFFTLHFAHHLLKPEEVQYTCTCPYMYTCIAHILVAIDDVLFMCMLCTLHSNLCVGISVIAVFRISEKVL